ncbi:MAG TPA: type II secretion system F family protein [Alphaproteobacteria bacterium]|nr:type II secretion system F family protein [Alphaproteobacteria bacterium]
MQFDTLFLVYGAIFLATVLLIEGIFALLGDLKYGSRRSINRRLQFLEEGHTTDDVLKTLRRDFRSGLLAGTELDRTIAQAGWTISAGRFVILLASASVAIGAGLGVSGLISPVIAAALGVVLGTVVPLLHLRLAKVRRLKRFSEQLPDALDVIVRSLRAGHPVASAMGLVAKEMPDPIGSEFGITVDEMTYGLALPDALANMAERVDQGDLKFVMVAINIQHGSGGNLAEVLSGISAVIRARFRMKQKIAALSAEGRLSAAILSVLPFLVSAFIFAFKGEYYMEHSSDPRIYIAVGSGFLLMVFGVIIMHRMVRFRF